MRVAAWLCAWTLLLTGLACADDFPLARDSWAKTDIAAVACAEGGDVDRLFDLLQGHDEEAAIKFSVEHGCRRLLLGTLGKIEDVSVFHGRYCFRPRGEPDCVWVRASSVSRASAPDPRPDQCDLTAQAIAKATDATWTGKSEVSGIITLNQSDIDKIEVCCSDANGKYTGTVNAVSVSSGDRPITAKAFNLLAAAGIVAFGGGLSADSGRSIGSGSFRSAAW
jgi:hypothetical protein